MEKYIPEGVAAVKLGSAYVFSPSPPNRVPSKENSAGFVAIGISEPSAGA